MIGKINYHSIKEIQSILPEFEKVDLLIMMFTHIMTEESMFVYADLSPIL